MTLIYQRIKGNQQFLYIMKVQTGCWFIEYK